MNDTINNAEIIIQIRALYRKDVIYQKIFDWLGRYQRNPNNSETLAKKIEEEAKVPYHKVKKLADELEAIGCAKFKKGRSTNGIPKSHSRIIWNKEWQVKRIVEVAKSKEEELLQPIMPTDDEDIKSNNSPDKQLEIEHSFQLRLGKPIILSLPKDFSVGEAERLANFIKTIPFAT